MKLYTKTGDRGETGLFSGTRISKADIVFEALGDIDELTAHLGVCKTASFISNGRQRPLADILSGVQSRLLDISSYLAARESSTTPGLLERLRPDLAAPTKRLEDEIDAVEALNTPLKNFILPGVVDAPTLPSALHLARAVTRRAERHVVALVETYEAGATDETVEQILAYMNRLSDYLFAQARHESGCGETAYVVSERRHIGGDYSETATPTTDAGTPAVVATPSPPAVNGAE